MGSRSNKQARTMAMAAHNPERAKELGIDIPQDVAREFVEKDRKSGRLKKAMKERRS